MPLFKKLKILKHKLQSLEQKTADGWMGKWAKFVMLKSLNSQIKDIETEISKRKNRLGGLPER